MALDTIPLLPGALPLVGHGPEFQRDRFAMLNRIAREIDDLGRLRLLTRDLVFANSPAAIHEVLVSKARSFEKSPMMTAALYPLAGEGLFTSSGALWRRQRRLMAPMFNHAKIDAFANAMVECTEHSTLRWQNDSEINVAAETTRIAMAVAGRTLFGIDTAADSKSLGDALTTALHWTDVTARSLPMLLQIELRLALLDKSPASGRLHDTIERIAARLEAPILWPGRRNTELRHALALLDQRVQRMIDERRNNSAQKDDLLARLLEARDDSDGSGMSDKQMRDEILTLFTAGHETTANGLAWSIYLLARDPELYARARSVVDALDGRAPTVADIERLDFLSCVFKEALRLYPPVYVFGRIATSDVVIAGHTLPKHTIVLISPWSVQRRSDLWRDASRFVPDRFAKSNEASIPQDAWIPFSDGPRVCIGAHFAMLEAPLVLASLLQRADFTLLDEREVVPDEGVTSRPRGGVRARIRLRPARVTQSSMTAAS